MPIPKPSKKEDQKKFTKRCMSDSVMKNEFPDIKQRYAVCMSQWKRKNKHIKEYLEFIEDMNEGLFKILTL